VASHLIHYLITLPILFALLVVSDIPITATAWWLPVIIVLQYELTLSIGFFVACLHVRFRDTQYLLGIFLMLGFFMTPILYEPQIVPERYLPIYDVNLMAYIVEAYRAALLRGETPDLGSLAIVAGVSTVMLVGFGWFFRRASTDFAEEI
jgi:ABC-type polysaccharide/polyol phosphate export permease